MSRLVLPTLETIEFQLTRIDDDAVERFANQLRADEPLRATYTEYDLHPRPSDQRCANWVFLIDSLNFSFWHADPADPFRIAYKGGEEFGYASLCAIIKRAIDEGYPMLEAEFWRDLKEPVWRRIARGVTCEMPLLAERLTILNATGATLLDEFQGDFANLIALADHDIYKMIDLVLKYFPNFNDQVHYAFFASIIS